ncbi:MAG: class I SAM-dependent methyltransferase [Actinomycetota bacterium]
MDEGLLKAAREAIGFMPEKEGLALYEAGLDGARLGPMVEIGSYCGKSAIYLGAAAEKRMAVLFSIDHHTGSEEHQPGEEYHDPRLIDPATGKIDTLPIFKQTIVEAGLENSVVAVVGDSAAVASKWNRPLGLVFIDGGHSEGTAAADLEGWDPHLVPGGLLVIHDVFPDPADGGRAPFNIYRRAIASVDYEEVRAVDSLRVLRKVEAT